LLTFEAKNLEDDQYEDFNGYPLPGRSYYFTVKYSL
jgi:iron complex outermembrane receptor protein